MTSKSSLHAKVVPIRSRFILLPATVKVLSTLTVGEQHLAGIQNIDGRTIEENPSRVENQQLINGRTYTMMVRVRHGRVEAFLDGKQLTAYHGDGSNLSMLDLWQLPDSQAIGIGAYESATTFHRIRVRPASDAAL